MTRFLCVGDLHLGAGPDYGREPGDRLKDQEAVWARALELAAEHDVDAVLFAGDAFHRRRPTPAELRAFQRPLQGLFADHGIEVLAINGNHDVEAAQLPSALEIFGREVDLHTQPGIWRAPDRVEQRSGEIVTVATLPWTPISRLVAAQNGGDRDRIHEAAGDVLIRAAQDLRAQIEGPAVLLLHWSVTGASTPTGVLTDDFREVVLELGALEALGFDAIVCGHIHKAQELAPGIFYTGSPAPVDFGEAETAHGCYLLDVTAAGAEYSFLPIASRPFVTHDLDLITHEGIFDLAQLPDVRDAVVRVRYRATEEQARRLDHHAMRDALLEQGAHKVYAIQPTIVREQRARVEGVDEELAPIAAVDLWLGANELNGWEADSLRALTGAYLETTGGTA